MRKITLFLLVCFPLATQALYYFNEIPTAQFKATEEGKLLIVQFSAKWCAPCQIMEENTWPNADVVAYCSQNCIVSKIDIDNKEGKNYAQEYGVKSIPTTLVFNVKGEMVGSYENSFSASRLLSFLQQYDTPANRTKESSSPNLQDYLTQFSDCDHLPSTDEIDVWEVPYGMEQESKDTPAYALVPIINSLDEAEININLEESIVYARSVSSVQQPITYQIATPVFKNIDDVSFNEVATESSKNTLNPVNNSRFGVQTGAFSTKKGAEIALQNIQYNHQLDGIILAPSDSNDTYFRVIVGAYSDKSDAVKIATYLLKSGTEAWARAY